MPFFSPSIFRTECDECNRRFPINGGGVCESCRRILCNEHLHGSMVRRIAMGLGFRITCVACRRGVPAETPDQ